MSRLVSRVDFWMDHWPPEPHTKCNDFGFSFKNHFTFLQFQLRWWQAPQLLKLLWLNPRVVLPQPSNWPQAMLMRRHMDVILMGIITRMECRLVFAINLQDSLDSHGLNFKVPRDPERPCELCYCIRNSTVCVMQECTLKVDGCDPIYQDGVCCPVKYMCGKWHYQLISNSQIWCMIFQLAEDGITIPGGLFDITRLQTTSTTPSTPHGTKCYQNGTFYDDGASIESQDPCEHCYCMKGDIVCAVEPCMGSMEGDTDSCVAQPPPEGECCPKEYKCGKLLRAWSAFLLTPFFRFVCLHKFLFLFRT